MASKGKSGEKINRATSDRKADIITPAKSLCGTSYERGYPAHDSMHINRGKSRLTGGK